jgi:large subunit ribosomal protein L28
MSRVCEITGKRGNAANNVSHANNKTKRRQLPNLHSKRIFIPELERSVRVRLSTRALRSIDKVGIAAFLKKNGMTVADLT